jgi:integrase
VYYPLPDFVVKALAQIPPVSERYFFWTGVTKLTTATRGWQAKLKKLFEKAKLPEGHAHRLSEAGWDMIKWKDEAHFVSWLRLSPDNRTSGDRIIGKGRLPTTNRVTVALKLAASNLRTSQSYLGAQFRRFRARLDINPVRDAMIPRRAAAPAETHAMNPDEVLAMLDALGKAGEHKARAAVALMFFTGLRPGEARGACWEDFDVKQLTVRQSICHTHTTSPKTKNSAKPVPVIEPLRSILADLQESDGNPASGPILRGPSGKPLDLHNLGNRVVIPTLRKAGISWHGWYSLRRGVVTIVTALSKDSLAAKGLLRHSSVSTTERHYIKDVPSTTLDAMKLLETRCNDCAKENAGKPAN